MASSPFDESYWKSLSHVWLFVTPRTIQSVEFSRPEYWSGFLSTGNFPHPVVEPRTPIPQADSLPAEQAGKPSYFMANRRGKGQSSDSFPLLGSEITAGGDCRHEIRRQLLLGRKAMTNLDSVLKNRDFTLPTKVCIVKARVFPVVICSCES